MAFWVGVWGLGGGGGGLDEEAVFEEWLEFQEERGTVRGEAVAEAVFDAAEGEVEVGEDEFVGFSADDGHEDDEFAGAGDDVALVWEFEGGAEFSVGIAELEGEALNGAFDAAGGGVACGVAACEGDEGEGVGVDDEDFLDLEAVGFFEEDVFVAAAGEEGLEAPEEAVDGAGRVEGAGGGRVFREGATDGGAEHGLEVGVDAVFTGIDGAADGVFDDGVEGFAEVVVGEVRGGRCRLGRFRRFLRGFGCWVCGSGEREGGRRVVDGERAEPGGGCVAAGCGGFDGEGGDGDGPDGGKFDEGRVVERDGREGGLGEGGLRFAGGGEWREGFERRVACGG